MAILKKPYKISIWKDRLEDSYYKEIQIAVIGSDTMTSPNKAFSPVLTERNNGEVTFTFSMAYKYFDPGAQAEVINPFIGYLIEERKVKLYYDGEWYDFLVKNHEEDSETNIWTYTCTDAFVNELSKVGYNIEFSTDLGNNQGTAKELAEKTLENTDWEVADADTLVQRVKEPMCEYTIDNSFTVLNTDTNQTETIAADETIYVFYSYIANKITDFVQFMRERDEDSFKFDSNNVIIGTNYRIETPVTYVTNEQTGLTSFYVDSAAVPPVRTTASPVTDTSGRPQYTSNQGFKLAFGQLTAYDPIMERTVNVYQTKTEPIKQIYEYVDSTYTTSDVVMSYVTNGSNFNVYTNGSLQGWLNATPSSQKEEGSQIISKLQEIGLTTYPEVGVGKDLVQLTDLTRITGYLELKFDNPLTPNYENTFLNTGFEDNTSFIDHISYGEKYILRLAAAITSTKHGSLTPLNLNGTTIIPPAEEGGQSTTINGKIRALVAEYTKEEEQDGSKRVYVNKINPKKIILQFDGDFEENNTLITEGSLNTERRDDQDQVIEEANTKYIIDGVVQEPSKQCVYVSGGVQYVWDDTQKKYILKSEATWFTNYYRTVTTALQPLPNSWLTEPANKLGIFVYVDNADLCGGQYIYISDIQITRGIECTNSNGQPDYVSIGNVPTTSIQKTSNFYLKPESGKTKTDIDIYFNPNDLGLGEIEPVYNKNSEKILSISEAQSNCFNILQTICETFECWLKIEVDHNSDGSITLDEMTHKPSKKVYLCEYCGKDNFAGFKYGVNLNSIQRTVNSDEIVTKLIVDNVQSDYVDSGVMSIRNASSNPSGEANILNFDYYKNKGLIENGEDCQADLDAYFARMKDLNNQLNEKEAERSLLETALLKTENKRNVYTELIGTAMNKYTDGLARFKEITGIDYNEYVEKYKNVADLTKNEPEIVYSGTGVYELGYGYYKGKNYRVIKYGTAIPVETTEEINIVSTSEDSPQVYELEGEWVEGTTATLTSSVTDVTFTIGIEALGLDLGSTYCDYDGDSTLTFTREAEGSVTINNITYTIYGPNSSFVYRLYEWSYDGSKWGNPIYEETMQPPNGSVYHNVWYDAWPNRRLSDHGARLLEDGDLTGHDSILDVIGQIYVSLSTINNYSGLLSNINVEYNELKEKLKGHPTYDFSVSYVTAEQGYETRLVLSDYIEGFEFDVYNHETPTSKQSFSSSVSRKVFAIPSVNILDTIEITSVPNGYKFEGDNPITVPYGIDWYKLEPINPMPGYEDEIKDIQKLKDAEEKEFFSKYGKFIKEGTWSSNDYIDADLYYLDAMQVSQTSAFPKVEYSINVAEVSELEGLENYTFAAGDKSYIEDTEFFGWAAFYVNNETQEATYIKPNDLTGYTIGKTPAREEVIVAQVEWHLDEPETNIITVQNYKTRFEDLFQRISATVQQVQYNEATYAKTASILDADGTINQNLLLASLNNVAGELRALTTDGSISINGDRITVVNINDTKEQVRISSSGISFSGDAGNTWHEAITGKGIDIGAVRTGSLNTDEVTIGNKDNPSFTWDKYGISAYKFTSGDTPYDLSTFVRFDQYGLYGIKQLNGYKATSLEDIKEKAHFGITWDGFFIKNSYTNGYVSITSDNDFQVIQGNNEKIKIGALEFDSDGNPIKYGINIKDNAGVPVFTTGDDGNITITGTINALGGNFTGIVNVGPEDNDRIIIDGGNALIKSSNYGGEGATTGWMIDKNGDAVFTNITARGAIRTAVFEYAEIQAVGGIFIFRPSSTIKEARVSGNDLILKVEKPLLFAKVSYDVIDNPTGNPKTQHWYERTNYGYQETEDTEVSSQKDYYIKNEVTNGSWCKISNYISDGVATDSTIQNILLTNGLTHVYQVTAINTTTKEVTLSGAAVMVTGQNPVTTLEELEGGALIDMGRKDGSSNYGIGVNSSDNTVNLPARAISLFETEIDETREPKVTYKYRGILGTLPQDLSHVDTSVYNYMKGTQGIYTDNMYLGDNNQFLAFYTDGNGDKRLRIKANQVLFENPDSPGDYEDVAETAGQPGPPGEDAITVKIDSSIGENFVFGNRTAILTCYVYKGIENITDSIAEANFVWSMLDKDGNPVSGWVPEKQGTRDGLLKNQIQIDTDDVDIKSVFYCNVTFA